MNSHSYVGASSAYRWLQCPGCVRLLSSLPERRRVTEYAIIGIAAHSLCEKALLNGTDPEAYLGEVIEVGGQNIPVTEAMVEATQVYVSKVRGDLATFGGTLLVEQRFELKWLHPRLYGRNDATLIPDGPFGVLRVYDYKNGTKAVQASGNTQCMYYALGALGEGNPMCVEMVECTIVQPNAWGKAAIDTWVVPAKDLYDWGRDVIVPGVLRAEDPDAPLVTGDWCCFCEAAGVCPAKRKEVLDKLDPPTVQCPVASLPVIADLTPVQLGQLSAFFTGEEFTSWVKAISMEERLLLDRGEVIPGRKLVESLSKGNRKWISEADAAKAFAEFGDEIYHSQLISPAAIERLMAARGVKKDERQSRVADLVSREEKRTFKVVNADDPRTAVSIRDHFEEVNENE